MKDEWISVKERLPPINKIVLGVTSRRRQLIVWVDDGTKEFDTQDISTEVGEKFTHWMPLPSPPNQGH